MNKKRATKEKKSFCSNSKGLRSKNLIQSSRWYLFSKWICFRTGDGKKREEDGCRWRELSKRERVKGSRAFTENKFLIKKIILLFKKFTHNSTLRWVVEWSEDEDFESLMNNLFTFSSSAFYFNYVYFFLASLTRLLFQANLISSIFFQIEFRDH